MSVVSNSPAAPAAERWRSGEYAECVHQGSWFLRGMTLNSDGPLRGEVLKVRKVVLTSARLSGRPVIMLAFDRWPARLFPITAFRKAAKPSLWSRVFARVRPARQRLRMVPTLPVAAAICSAAAAAVSQILESDR